MEARRGRAAKQKPGALARISGPDLRGDGVRVKSLEAQYAACDARGLGAARVHPVFP